MNRGSLPGNHVLFIFPFFGLVFFGGRGYFCISISNSMVPSIEKHWSYPNDSPEHIRVKTFSIIKHWLGNWQLSNLPAMSDLKKKLFIYLFWNRFNWGLLHQGEYLEGVPFQHSHFGRPKVQNINFQTLILSYMLRSSLHTGPTTYAYKKNFYF